MNERPETAPQRRKKMRSSNKTAPGSTKKVEQVALERRKSLVMWSGGLDSTYGLMRLLTTTDDDVYAHHIHRQARHDSGRKAALTLPYEAEAIGRMTPWIRARYRGFTYSESNVDITAFPKFARDTATSMFFAGLVTRRYGFGPQDRILLSMNRDEDREWNPDSEKYWFLRMITLQTLKLVWQSEEVPDAFLWAPPPSKQEEIDFLPPDLVAMTASCRDPKAVKESSTGLLTWQTCGTCDECKTLSGARYGVAVDKSLPRPLRLERTVQAISGTKSRTGVEGAKE
ncbi:hypothetical protein [Dongia sp.]|uniref:hypothetical protein n=1 Tax=Dongia sp. TaxID=1977262 RepID=UPI0035B4AC55